MAILKLEDGTLQTNIKQIAQELEPLNIQLNRWVVADKPQLQSLLAQDSLNEEEKEQLLKTLDGYFQQLQQTSGYQTRDLMVMHPGIPNLDDLLAKFDRIHTHAEDELRYIIDGECVFGFVRPDGSQIELTVQKEECINVPAGTEHWFHLTKARRVKAVRYFTGTQGWIPFYSDKHSIRLTFA